MRRLLATLVTALMGLCICATASGFDTPPRLNEVAHVYSLGVGEVRCPTDEEWGGDVAATLGYTNMQKGREYAVLSPVVCRGALGVGTAEVPDWQQALGVLVLVHESFHLRRWRWRRNEAKVECQALVYFREASVRLGATPEHAHALYAYALALNAYQSSVQPQYRDRNCRLAPWAPPFEASLGG
jgi:hypothetical protein